MKPNPQRSNKPQHGRQPLSSVSPEFVRIPAPGCFCPVTSLGRQKIQDLIKEKRIKSIMLPPKGKQRSVRLVHLPSLLEFMRAQMEAAQ